MVRKRDVNGVHVLLIGKIFLRFARFKGCFDLDPNRVIDIMLESFEQRLHLQEFYLPLLKLYGTDSVTLCHILGFRFFTYSVSVQGINSAITV